VHKKGRWRCFGSSRHFGRWEIAWLILFLLHLCNSTRASAQDELEEMSRAERVRSLQQRSWDVWATRCEIPPQIDGRLDDPAWEHAQPVTEFYQRERNEGLPATESTEVRVLYDSENLYIGFRCFDSQPERMTARAIFRDEAAAFDDLVLVSIDPYHDHRSSIHFASNANGWMIDALQTGEDADTRNIDWDTVWQSRGSRRPDGWEVEIAIPFKSLRFHRPRPEDEIVFGIGFKRNIRRKNEEDHWPFVSNDSSWYRPAELGHLRGLDDISPGRNLKVRPYVLSGVSRDAELVETDRRLDVGVDAKWGITSGLTADLTVNTDFAQEEVDIQQINFTRFPLFFPEKRQFFLEGEQMFQFGIPGEAELVFTRRIGLSGLGEIVPIKAGARLSGREGRYSIGAMNIQTNEAHGLPSENFTVLRFRRDLLDRSSIGGLFTNRQGGGYHNRVYGADATFLIDDAWSMEGFIARTEETGSEADAAYLRLGYNVDLFGAAYKFLDIEEGFRPGVGFVRRSSSRENFGEIRFSPRPDSPWIRQFHAKASLQYVTDRGDFLETRQQAAEWTTAFESGDALTFRYTRHFEAIDAPFSIAGGLVIEPGTYHFDDFETAVSSYRGRPIKLDVAFKKGGFWGGKRTILSTAGTYRVNKHLDIRGNYEVNWIEHSDRDVVTHLLSTRLQIAFRSDVVFHSLFQYNHDTGLLSTNIRFNWIPKPGSDFFIVYNELDQWNGIFGLRNRSLVVKLNYLFAL
jgi:hypothetical protein